MAARILSGAKRFPRRYESHPWRDQAFGGRLDAEKVNRLAEAQGEVDAAFERLYMTSDSGEPDQAAVLDYEMALNDLLEAKAKAGL